jgi:hypothetical protein
MALFRKFKEIKELRGGVLVYAAQAIPPIDAEIAKNCSFLVRKLIGALNETVDEH